MSHIEKNDDSTRVTFSTEWLDSIRVTINDSRLWSESFLQNFLSLEWTTQFVCTKEISIYCFSDDQDWRKFSLLAV